jgi:hypothetical protein
MFNGIMVVMCQELGGEENFDHVMPNIGNNTEMQILGAFLLEYIGNAIGLAGLTECVDILADRDGNIKWHRRKRKQL